jgi:hypothetical protein
VVAKGSDWVGIDPVGIKGGLPKRGFAPYHALLRTTHQRRRMSVKTTPVKKKGKEEKVQSKTKVGRQKPSPSKKPLVGKSPVSQKVLVGKMSVQKPGSRKKPSQSKMLVGKSTVSQKVSKKKSSSENSW